MVHESPSSPSSPSVRATLTALRSLFGPDHFESRAPTHEGLVFSQRTGRGTPPLADVYLPDDIGDGSETSVPSVVLIHGGGFLIGSRRMKPMRMLSTALVDAGFAVCSLDYRLVFRGGRLAEATEDVLAGLSWWHETAGGYGVDTSRTAAIGLSAGGALMVLAAGAAAAPPIARTVGVFGLYDLRSVHGALMGRLPRLVTRSDDPGAWFDASPIANLQPSGPMLLLHGGADRIVGPEQAQALASRRSEDGLETEVRIYDGAPHAFLNAPGPVADQAVADIGAFLAPLHGAHLRGAA